MTRPLLLVLLLTALLPAAASAQSVVDDNPAVTSSAAGRLDVAARAADGTIVVRNLDTASGAWSPWEAVRGLAASSGPAIAADDDGTLHLFARDAAGAGVLESVRGPAGWSAWATPTGGTLLNGPGASNRQGTAELDLGAIGLDGAFFQAFKTAPGTEWNPFARIGASGTTAPGMVSRGPSLLDAFTRAGDGSVTNLRYVPGASWTPSSLGGTVVGAITAISRATNQMDVYARGINGLMYGNTFNGEAWSGFSPFAETAGTSAPAATTTGGGRVDLVVRDGSTLFHRFYDPANLGPDRGWQSFSTVGPIDVPVDRGAVNGAGGGDGATLTAGLSGKKTRTYRIGRSISLGGTVRNAAGAPVSGATIGLVSRRLARGSKSALAAFVTSDGDGNWSAKVKVGPGKRFTASYKPFANDVSPAAQAAVTARTRAAVRLRVSRRSVRRGQRVTFSGRLLGGAVPRSGKLVVLQAYERRRWRPFANPRAKREGRFKARYRFTAQPARPVKLRFRVVVPSDAAYPFTRGTSKRRTVTLRP